MSFLFALLIALSLAPPTGAYSFKALVIGVSDGDTITVLDDRQPERIRLAGIDCPEKKQDFGQVAKEFTADHCFRQLVTVEATGRDRYGRTIGEILLPDGQDLNHELVAAGLAWWYRKYAPSDMGLAQLESRAHMRHLGLWSKPDAIPPWNYRHSKLDLTLPSAIHPSATIGDRIH